MTRMGADKDKTASHFFSLSALISVIRGSKWLSYSVHFLKILSILSKKQNQFAG
jgi:hypothetical protein